jgi:uncharacterized protein DUF3891
MIVRPHGASLLLITQPDHAALAARIMDRWLIGGFPGEPRRASILRAIAEHDNGWREVDAAPLLDEATGRVQDFISAPVQVRQSVWPRAVERLADDPTSAALVAEHAIQIYSRFRDDAAWNAFFAEMAMLRNEHASRAGLPAEAIERQYFFVRAGDLISLTFCNAWAEVQQIGGHDIQLREGGVVTIRPDPFGGSSVPFDIPARAVHNRSFRSAAEAADAFRNASVITLSGIVRPE